MITRNWEHYNDVNKINTKSFNKLNQVNSHQTNILRSQAQSNEPTNISEIKL